MDRFRERIFALTSLVLLIVACELLTTSVSHAQDSSASQWRFVPIPDAWRKEPTGELAPIDGYSWYRCMIRVPEAWKGEPLTLFVEALDDARSSYVNGVIVGATGNFPPRQRSGLGEQGQYELDPGIVKYGTLNTIAIRVFQNDPRPNFNVAPPVLFNAKRSEAIRMNGKWQYRPGDHPDGAVVAKGKSWLASTSTDVKPNRDRGLFEDIDEVVDLRRYVARRAGDHDPLSADEAEAQFQTPDDLEFQLVLSEPEIAQPLFVTWDERGRLWVNEYLQYPDPEGLKMVSRDVYLRTVYDKVPPPPPNHFVGRDRISVHEDTDGDGVYDTHKVFVAGLNIATSLALGRGGVWVTNPPYLLFYPDRNRDDVPDGPPEVHLAGFGLEDTHSVINSLRFGPDGWLYAAQGSTVSARIKQPPSDKVTARTMGQQIWRYHPERRTFEVFAEGGGNTFGVEIDSKGRIFSGHNGGDTRGFHYEQGSYSRKGFGKHGALSNPYAFGYFEHMKHHSVPRFTHNFIIYEADRLPARYRGRLFGVEPLQGQVVMSSFAPFQSSFETEDIERVVKTSDQWFRPVDIKLGPDGCIYVADFYEQRIDHSSHYAGRVDRTNGRIYRLKPKGSRTQGAFDYSNLEDAELLQLLEHANKWHRQTALRLLADRQASDLIPTLAGRLEQTQGQLALEQLWALHAVGGLTTEAAQELLGHRDPFVRAWTVRLICDRNRVEPVFAKALADLAAQEPYIAVRKQLASSAQRIETQFAIPIIRNLLRHDGDAKDIHQPLLLWWALERHATDEGRELIFDVILAKPELWRRPLMTEHLIERLMRRYALAGSRRELLAAAKLLEAAPDSETTERLLTGFEQAYQGRSLVGIPQRLVNAIAKSGGGSTALKLRQADPEAIRLATRALLKGEDDLETRQRYLQIFGELQRPQLIPVLLQVAKSEQEDTLIAAALAALQPFGEMHVGEAVIDLLPRLGGGSQEVGQSLLASRSSWTKALLRAVGRGQVESARILDSTLRRMLLHDDDEIHRLVAKHWGQIAKATTVEMRDEAARVKSIVEQAAGNPKKGKPLFMQHCGKCHRLFDEGGSIGPDLTSFQRSDLSRVLLNVVNPSAEIREGFENHVLVTTDGQVVSGFLADQDNQVVVLRSVDGQNRVFRRDMIDELAAIPESVMPEGTLKELDDQQLRDLFAYLRSSQPVNY